MSYIIISTLILEMGQMLNINNTVHMQDILLMVFGLKLLITTYKLLFLNGVHNITKVNHRWIRFVHSSV